MPTRSDTSSARQERETEDLAKLLRLGPFSTALRAAIAARGLGLDRIQDRLRQQGIQVSTATLSYWQSGSRHPERAESLRALKLLEPILELPPGSLSALLGASTRRDSRARSGRTTPVPERWPGRPEVADLLAEIPTAPDTSLRRLVQRDRVIVGPEGLIRSMTCSQTMRAERDGVDRCPFVFGSKGHTGQDLPTVTNLRNCELGRVVGRSTQGLIGGEFVFERPLHRGETVRIEYELENPPDADDSHYYGDSYSRCFLHAVPVYLVELCFDSGALPERCQQFKGKLGDRNPRMIRNLGLGVSNTVFAVGQNFGPGYFGIHWHPELPEVATSDRVVDWSSHWSSNIV
jgi:hypothetical protein